MRSLLVKLVFLASFLLVIPVKAQGSVHLTSASIDLWPEYDQPGVLVIYHLQLAQDTALPASLTLRIPAAAQLNAVASQDSTKGLVNAPYQSTVQGDQSLLTITASSLNLQVEYYVSLVKDGTTRHITFEWPGDNPVDALTINFLLPPASSGLTINPAPVTSGPGQGGLTNYVIRAANLPSGKPFSVSIEYQRQTDELSIASLPVQAVSTPGANTAGFAFSPNVLQWILGGMGVLLIGGGVFGFVRWRRESGVPSARRRHKSAQEEVHVDTVYCSECGKRAQPGDLFCRTCGAKLRLPESE